MALWEVGHETRLLIAPDLDVTVNGVGHFLSLRHPKFGNSLCYLLINGTLHELNWFKRSYGSWFIGDYVCQDGRLYTATPVDPVFILLPIFEEARMKKGDDPGKFRQLDEIIFVNGYPGYSHLLPIAEKSMQVVCEIKEIGSTKFFRLHDAKVLAWLLYKVQQLKLTLPRLDKNYAAQNERDTLADAVSIIGEYLMDEPWLQLLCNYLKLSLPEARSKPLNNEILTFPAENSLRSSDTPQTCDKGTNRSKRQTKKAKVETDSRNIKEMFTRASRRKR